MHHLFRRPSEFFVTWLVLSCKVLLLGILYVVLSSQLREIWHGLQLLVRFTVLYAPIFIFSRLALGLGAALFLVPLSLAPAVMFGRFPILPPGFRFKTVIRDPLASAHPTAAGRLSQSVQDMGPGKRLARLQVSHQLVDRLKAYASGANGPIHTFALPHNRASFSDAITAALGLHLLALHDGTFRPVVYAEDEEHVQVELGTQIEIVVEHLVQVCVTFQCIL
jgi:hypothetical protein